MSACTYGASVKSGVDPTAYVPIDKSAATLIGAVWPWWASLLSFMWIPDEVQVSDLCALNPDDPTLPSAGDIAKAFLGFGPSLRIVNDWIKAKLTYLVFQSNCTCNASTPTSCTGWQFANSGYTLNGGSGIDYEVGMTWAIDASCVTDGAYVYNPGGSTVTYAIHLWDATSHALIASGTTAGVPPLSHNFGSWSGGPYGLTAGHSYVVSFRSAGNVFGAQGIPTSLTLNPYAHCTASEYNPAGGSFPATSQTTAFGVHPNLCAGSVAGPPPTPTNPTQPPTITLPSPPTCGDYQSICDYLQQLELKINYLITLIPSSPKQSLAESTAHAGLTGTGTLAVSAIRAVLVSLTTIPPNYGSSANNPVLHWDVGRVAYRNSEGWSHAEWIGTTPQVVMVDPSTTEIGYWLNSGVVATITELTAGPF